MIKAGRDYNIKIWDLDFNDINIRNMEKNFNGSELHFGVCDMINKQKVFNWT